MGQLKQETICFLAQRVESIIRNIEYLTTRQNPEGAMSLANQAVPIRDR